MRRDALSLRSACFAMALAIIALVFRVYDRAFPLPTPHEDSSIAHRGHGPLVHKHQGCFSVWGGLQAP